LKQDCAFAAVMAVLLLSSCGDKKPAPDAASAAAPDVSVAVAKVASKNLVQTLTISSELVPFQEIDVYAKESGYVTDLRVD